MVLAAQVRQVAINSQSTPRAVILWNIGSRYWLQDGGHKTTFRFRHEISIGLGGNWDVQLVSRPDKEGSEEGGVKTASTRLK